MSTPAGPPSSVIPGVNLSPIIPSLSQSQVSESPSSTSLRSTLSSGLEEAFSQGLAICSMLLESQREASEVEVEVNLFYSLSLFNLVPFLGSSSIWWSGSPLPP